MSNALRVPRCATTQGTIVLNPDLEAMVNQMYSNTLPSAWRPNSYPSLKPLASYMQDFAARIDFYQKWIREGPPLVYWLSGIFFPHALLTASLQNFARKHKLPIDVVVFDFSVTRNAVVPSLAP